MVLRENLIPRIEEW